MQRISDWFRWIFTVILIPILIGVVTGVAVDLIKQQPREILEQTWFRVTTLLLVGFVAGLWVDWLLLKLDRSRADRRKNFGHEMVNLHFAFNALRSQGRDPMRAKKQELKSCFVSAKKFGVWAPDDQVFNLDPDIAENLIAKYLSNVGTKLKDGHFGKAKQAAEKSKAAFTAAYAGR